MGGRRSRRVLSSPNVLAAADSMCCVLADGFSNLADKDNFVDDLVKILERRLLEVDAVLVFPNELGKTPVHYAASLLVSFLHCGLQQ